MELVEPIAINTKIKSKKDLKESLQILQTWFSPSFPVGSFSYSHGLEAMINDNFIKSKELEDKVDARWEELGLSELENIQPRPELFGYVIDELMRQKQINNS